MSLGAVHAVPARDAIVVGAGLAGLAAALRLRARGYAVTVLEREDAPGGRARGVALAGHEIDPCATLLFSTDTAVAGLLRAVGQPDELEPWPDGALQRADAAGGLHPLRTARPDARHRPEGLTRRDLLRSARLDRLAARHGALLDRLAPEGAAVLDDRSAAEWARLYFGERVLARWVAPWLAASTLGDEDETSRLVFLLQYAATRRGAPAGLRSGPGPLAEALARRVPTRFGVSVDEIAPGPGGFEVHGREGGTALRLGASAVVLAVPPRAALAAAGAVLTTAEKDHLSAVRMRPAVSVAWVARDAGPTPARRIVVSDPERVLRSLQFPATGLQGRTSEPLVAVASDAFARGCADRPDEVVMRRLVADVERLAPRHVREILASRVTRWDPGIPCFEVGAYRALERLRRVEAWQLARGRRLVMAGDHLLGPRLEDAIASGLRAADALARA